MSLAQSRSSRQLAPNSKQQALAKLASLKQGGLKRTEQFAVAEEGDVYEDVDEDEYQELVKKRREDNFIEDDDGGGYADFGQDDWDDADYSGDEDPMVKRAKGDGGERSLSSSQRPRRGAGARALFDHFDPPTRLTVLCSGDASGVGLVERAAHAGRRVERRRDPPRVRALRREQVRPHGLQGAARRGALPGSGCGRP